MRELYAAPPAAFIAARDALARALAAEGSSEAARVRNLRRPTIAVWLLNAVARERPDALTALFAAGDHLRHAQARAVRGDAAELRAASAAVHDAIGTALAAAREITAGVSLETGAAVLGQVERGLRAVATGDVAARESLRGGVLERLPEPGGIELLTGLATVRRPADARQGAGRRGPAVERRRPGPGPRDGRAAERLRKAAERSARGEAARRERERRQLVAEADRRERARRVAEERLHEAERQLQQVQLRVTAARKESEEARKAARAARASADAAGGDGSA